MTDKPQSVILDMGTGGYFNLMAKLMGGAAPPAAEDAPILASMAKIGIVPGKPFEMNNLDPAVQGRSERYPAVCLEKDRGQQGQARRDSGRLGDHKGTRHLRHQLPETRRGGGVRLACQSAARRGVSLYRGRCCRTEVERHEQVH